MINGKQATMVVIDDPLIKKRCPKCGELNDNNWPLEIDGKVVEGGCQMCWEEQCSKEWWKMMEKIDNLKIDCGL